MLGLGTIKRAELQDSKNIYDTKYWSFRGENQLVQLSQTVFVVSWTPNMRNNCIGGNTDMQYCAAVMSCTKVLNIPQYYVDLSEECYHLVNSLTPATGAGMRICHAVCPARIAIRHAHKFTEHNVLQYEIMCH